VASNLSNLVRACVVPALIVLAWAFVAISGQTPAYVLPSPLKVAETFWEFVFGGGNQPFAGTFWLHFWASLQRVAAGFCVGAGLAIPLGIALGYSETLARYFEPTIQLTRAIPGICWLPLALIWFGIGTATSVFLISLGSFYAVLVSTLQGVKYVDTKYLRAARCLGANERDILTSIIFPAAFPSILSGLRIGLSYSWVYMVLGEFTGVNTGLGATLLQSRETLETDLIIVLMILIGVIGYISDYLMLLLTRRFVHG